MIDKNAIRERAYELWELQGRPEGEEEHFWRLAEEQLQTEQESGERPSESFSGGIESGVAPPAPTPE
ncbi:DUF2934 domain-containing protein [Pseudomonas sp. BN414]|uniref:DUF2934 domain-containing protein n=1 Tax=Pseudomonas sp. BN414 TaxID=2567888 RepID=UPI002456A6D1|nr:DUF2934 domain-containing protein [Pseudomonas sp. BN414]MDH4565679.1 DUF2934 domain-containing protein [Pseudomonas sp. BN414]